MTKGADTDRLVLYAYLHLGEGDEARGREEVERAWRGALPHLGDLQMIDTAFVSEAIAVQHPATLARLFFQLHFYFARRSET